MSKENTHNISLTSLIKEAEKKYKEAKRRFALLKRIQEQNLKKVVCPRCQHIFYSKARPDFYGRITCNNCHRKIRPQN